MVEIVGIVFVLTIFAFALTALARVWARDARRRAAEADRELRPAETETGKCGACGGEGWRWDGATHPTVKTCWRCRGSGLPP